MLYVFLTADPFEETNLASDYPHIVTDLKRQMMTFERSMIAPHVADEVLAGNPNFHGGVWSSGWCHVHKMNEKINL